MIHLELPWLPPSSNKAYFNLPNGKGRALTKEGREFKNTTLAYFAQKYPREMTFFKPNVPYALAFRFGFPTLTNAGFPDKAKNKYKVFDGGNRLKLLEDALKDAGGIDDSQTLHSLWAKIATGTERTDVWAWNLEEEASPLGFIVNF